MDGSRTVTIVAGIDLGLSGAITAIHAEERRILWIEDMPTLEIAVGRKARRSIDVHRLLNLIQSLSDTGCELAVVEQPGYRPGQKGAGTVGQGFGMVLMGCFAVDPVVRTEIVSPAGWKASLRVPAAKAAAVKRAVALFPASAHLFYGPKNGPLDGRAESALLGLFGCQRFLGIRV
jgi:hypothetical protein